MAETNHLSPCLESEESCYPTKNSHLNNETKEKFKFLLKSVHPSLIEEMKGKSLDMIMIEVWLASTRLSVINRRLEASFKRESQQEMNQIVKRKVQSYQQKLSLFTAALEGCAEVTSALVGGGLLKGLAIGAAVGARSATSQLDRSLQAEQTAYDHLVKQQDEQINRYSSGRQDAKQTNEIIDRIVMDYFRQTQEAFRSIAGG